MKFNTKHIAITAGLGAVLALSPVVGPVSTAFAATTDGAAAASEAQKYTVRVNVGKGHDFARMPGAEDSATRFAENYAPEGQEFTGLWTVAKSADPICAGYTFLGWFTDTALTQEFDFATPVTADMTLYAKWQRNADEQPGTDEDGSSDETETPTTPGASTETPAAGEQGSSDEGASNGLPQTGDIAAAAVAGTGVLGAAIAGIGAFASKRRK